MKPTELVMLRNANGEYLSQSAYDCWALGEEWEKTWTDNLEEAAVFPAEDSPPIGEGMRLESAYED